MTMEKDKVKMYDMLKILRYAKLAGQDVDYRDSRDMERMMDGKFEWLWERDPDLCASKKH